MLITAKLRRIPRHAATPPRTRPPPFMAQRWRDLIICRRGSARSLAPGGAPCPVNAIISRLVGPQVQSPKTTRFFLQFFRVYWPFAAGGRPRVHGALDGIALPPSVW